jgi:hypothetical protein
MGASSLVRAQSSAMADSGDESNMMDDLIDQKAQKAKGNDESAVGELADEVFATPYFMEVPSDFREAMKQRVLSDELKYRHGKKGIKEEKVVETVDELARKLNAPDYAKTSPLQVRTLRVRLMRGYPNFIAQETSEERKGLKKKVGDTINPEMSPLEAVFVTGVLLQQKMLNEDFQHPPQEWEDKLRKKQLKRWETGENQDAKIKARLHPGNNDKRREMRHAVANGIAKMKVSELLRLPDETLDTLGIERNKETSR